MQSIRWISLLMLLGSVACTTAPKESLIVKAAAIELRPEQGLVFYQNKPFTGIAHTAYTNGELAESVSYVNGKKQGSHKKWFDSGTLSYEANYELGKLEGVVKTWWRNGNLRSESRFQEGKAHGTQLQWYTSGAKFKEMNLVLGKEEGMQKAWRKNGKIYNNYEAKEGRIFGLKRANLCYELDNEIVQYRQ